jgi:hypothetical protein
MSPRQFLDNILLNIHRDYYCCRTTRLYFATIIRIIVHTTVGGKC